MSNRYNEEIVSAKDEIRVAVEKLEEI